MIVGDNLVSVCPSKWIHVVLLRAVGLIPTEEMQSEGAAAFSSVLGAEVWISTRVVPGGTCHVEKKKTQIKT